LQSCLGTHHNLRGLRTNLKHIPGLAICRGTPKLQALALADREPDMTIVLTEFGALLVDYFSWARRNEVPQPLPRVTLWNKADVIAIWLIGDG